MIKIFTTKNSLGSVKAREFFLKNDIDFIEKDFSSIPLNRDELIDILYLTENGFDDIISINSKTYHNVNINFNELDFDEALDVICQYPTLLSRPIIVQYINGNPLRMLVGYSKNDIEIFLRKDHEQYFRSIPEEEIIDKMQTELN